MDSRDHNLRLLQSVMKASILALLALVGALIVLSSTTFFPPEFESGLLKGRESYFYSWYAVAFYTHVISAPVALFAGLLQSMNWLRVRNVRLHRSVGKLYVYVVLLFATPSGLVMSLKADGSILAVAGFAVLAIAAAWTTWLGLKQIRRGDVAKHRRWMTRSYLLIASAVTLRFLAAITNEFALGINYDAMAWLCWAPQIAVYELLLFFPSRILGVDKHGDSALGD